MIAYTRIYFSSIGVNLPKLITNLSWGDECKIFNKTLEHLSYLFISMQVRDWVSQLKKRQNMPNSNHFSYHYSYWPGLQSVFQPGIKVNKIKIDKSSPGVTENYSRLGILDLS